MTDRELLERYRLALQLIAESSSLQDKTLEMIRIASIALREGKDKED